MAVKTVAFFYGGPLSQWYPCTFVIDGATYNCAEQWMMAQKARLFWDVEALARIMATRDPAEQKALGKKVRGFKKAVWEAVARDVVVRGNLAKFSQNRELLAGLLDMHEDELVEASATDCIWGIGLDQDDPAIHDRANWRGTNWLGLCLMEVRDALLESVQYQP